MRSRRIAAGRTCIRVVLLAMLTMVGACHAHVLGTHDVAMDFEIQPAESGIGEAGRSRGAHVEDVVAAVERRLMAGQVGAEVEARGTDGVRVIVDDADVDQVDELLAWRGGIVLYRTAPEVQLTVAEAPGVAARTASVAPGVVEHYFVGAPDALERIVDRAHLAPGYRVLIEYVENESFRTRVVNDAPVADLSDALDDVSTVHGNTLVLELTPEGIARVERARVSVGGAPVAFVRHRAVLAVGPLPATPSVHTLTIPLGTEIFAYTRAHNARRLLSTPALPVLRSGGLTALPVRGGIAAASLILPLLLSLAWLFFVRRFDRARPEPWWLVAATFALGGFSVVPAAGIESLLMRASPYLNPTVMTFGGQTAAFPLALLVFTLVVGLSEEGAKFMGVFVLARRRREFDEPVDGIVYGAASSLGFAALENMKYFADGRLSATLVVSRSFLSIPAHLFFGAIWGYAMGRSLVSRRARVPLFVLLAALMHGAFDALLSTDGLGALAIALNLALATVFVMLLRRSLRHGAVAVDGTTQRASSEPRLLFAVGSPLRFVLCAVAVHVLALALFVQGAALEARHGRVTVAFMVLASWLVTSLGLAAYGIAESVPLDAAVDGAGITFAGTSVPWERVVRVRRSDLAGGRARLQIDATDGVLSIGPGRPAVIARLEAAVADGLRSYGPYANARSNGDTPQLPGRGAVG